jgi:putative FmdB family regulatory protein
MPTYEYACRDCGEHLEVVQSFRDDALTVCPGCEGDLRKVFSAAGIIFKGSGWHIKDYADSKSGRSGGSASASDKDGSSGDASSSESASDGSKGSSSTGSSAAAGSNSSGSDSGSGSSGSSDSSAEKSA